MVNSEELINNAEYLTLQTTTNVGINRFECTSHTTYKVEHVRKG